MGRLLHRIDDGVAAAAARREDGGWYAAALVQSDIDLRFREPLNAVWNETPDALLPGANLSDWAAAAAEPSQRRIVMVNSACAGEAPEVLAGGAGLGAPAVVRHAAEGPVVGWLRHGESGCQVFLHEDGAAKCVWEKIGRASCRERVCHRV